MPFSLCCRTRLGTMAEFGETDGPAERLANGSVGTIPPEFL